MRTAPLGILGHVLILLPPSETKTRSRRGTPMRLESLSFPALTGVREEIIDGLIDASRLPDAMEVLGVPATLGAEVDANLRLRVAPAKPAIEIYTGVLYDALSWATLSPAGRRRAARRLLISSAVYGVTRPGDRIAPYRTAIDADLPGAGRPTNRWKAALDAVLAPAAGPGLIVDCRSGPYAATWAPSGPLAGRWVAVRVPRASHWAKHTRGLVARALCESPADPRRPAALVDLLAAEFDVSLTGPERAGRPWVLDALPR